MSGQTKALLSIGMIFKNEIRCLERCMKSLQPLREAVSCELVMADTGSSDGSREVAERYADVLFDFPWVDDFAAARNAVIDRCSGQWYLSVDADEWLDEDISELVDFLRTPSQWKEYKGLAFMMRNYLEQDFNGAYNEFMAPRMILMSLGMRYEGRIHERWRIEKTNVLGIQKPLIHHDGYVDLNQDNGRAKRERNMPLLRKKLEDNPDDLLTRMQCLESSADEEQIRYVRLAVEGVEEKLPEWEQYGPPIYRHAVNGAKGFKLPELWTWINRARELFPQSIYIKVDVAYTAFVDRFDNKEYEEALQEGERYLKGLGDYQAWRFDPNELLSSALDHTVPAKENTVRICMSSACHELGRDSEAWRILQKVKIQDMPLDSVRNYVGMLLNLYAQANVDTSKALISLWEEVKEDKTRRNEFLSAASQTLPKSYREQERLRGFRHACMGLASLADQCELGRAAKVISLEKPEEIEAVLDKVEDWNQFSIHALLYALDRGARFPLPGKPLALEEMDRLADRIAHAGNEILDLNEKAGETDLEGDVQALCWARALALSVLEVFPWRKVEGENIGRGLTAARVFARVERMFLPVCYAPEALCAERLFLLPPMHRFGWYMVQAFDALEAGDKMGYVRLLREGLSTNENMRSMVEFLLEHTPELASPPPPAELIALADQVRTLLAMYPGDDPAVEALKASEAYQKVAHLIESIPVPVFGGLKQ